MATPFPPSGPTTALTVAPSYLYVEYNDDPDLQAFISAYNNLAQQYLTWFNTVNLPVYTGLSGSLLDWVAQGLYGEVRPALASGRNVYLGPFNTWMFNQIELDHRVTVGPSNVVATSDDTFQRIITWNYFKGDGRVFNIRWLKRRIQRFLDGIGGTAPLINNTWQISVSFGVGNEVSIRLLTQERAITQSALYNSFMLNSRDSQYNYWTTEIVFNQSPLPEAPIFVEAFQSGALQMPFQFEYTITD